jgi:hypothetical protein
LNSLPDELSATRHVLQRPAIGVAAFVGWRSISRVGDKAL